MGMLSSKPSNGTDELEPKKEFRSLWIDYEASAASIPVHHANEVVVQTHQHEMFLSFFFTSPPIFMGTPQEQEKYKNVASLEPTCVARINMTPRVLRSTIKVLQEQLEKYEASNKGDSDEDTD